MRYEIRKQSSGNNSGLPKCRRSYAIAQHTRLKKQETVCYVSPSIAEQTSCLTVNLTVWRLLLRQKILHTVTAWSAYDGIFGIPHLGIKRRFPSIAVGFGLVVYTSWCSRQALLCSDRIIANERASRDLEPLPISGSRPLSDLFRSTDIMSSTISLREHLRRF